jgi:hypothetical protein
MNQGAVIGIDHGAKGGVCVLTLKGVVEVLIPMPDLNVIRDIAKTYDAHLWIEELSIHPRFSRTVICTLARNLGRIEGHFRAFQRRITTVRPQVWQQVMYSDPRLASLEGKGRSFAACEILDPTVNLIPSARAHKEHDGMADAYLIARYGLMMSQAREIA